MQQPSVDPDPTKPLTTLFSELAEHHQQAAEAKEREANEHPNKYMAKSLLYDAALNHGAHHAYAVANNIAQERGL